jgi:hypothetical protein
VVSDAGFCSSRVVTTNDGLMALRYCRRRGIDLAGLPGYTWVLMWVCVVNAAAAV